MTKLLSMAVVLISLTAAGQEPQLEIGASTSLTMLDAQNSVIARCDMAGDKVSNCRIAEGHTLDELMQGWQDAYAEAWKYHEEYVESIRKALAGIRKSLEPAATPASKKSAKH